MTQPDEATEYFPAVSVIQNYGTVVQGNTGVVGDIHAQNVQIGDFNVLQQQLAGSGLTAAEIEELRGLLDQLRSAAPVEKPSKYKQALAWVAEKSDRLMGYADRIIKVMDLYAKITG